MAGLKRGRGAVTAVDRTPPAPGGCPLQVQTPRHAARGFTHISDCVSCLLPPRLGRGPLRSRQSPLSPSGFVPALFLLATGRGSRLSDLVTSCVACDPSVPLRLVLDL